MEDRVTRRAFMGSLAGLALMPATRAALQGQAPLQVAGIDHVGIRVSDLQQSTEFYGRLFGAEVLRSPKPIIAHPTSVPSPHNWLRLGRSYLALSLASRENGRPSIDHYCLAVRGIDQDGLARQLDGLNRQYADASGADVWARDPAGYIIQITPDPEGYWTRLNSMAGAVRVADLEAAKRKPAFRPLRIAHISLAVSTLEDAAAYYRKLLGDAAVGQSVRNFRAGPALLMLADATAGEHVCIGVADFDPVAAAKTLEEVGITAIAPHDENVVEFKDPDGIAVQISGAVA